MKGSLNLSDEWIAKLVSSGLFQPSGRHMSEEQLLDYLLDIFSHMSASLPKVICLIGGAASGKSTLAQSISERKPGMIVLSTDDFVKGTRKFRTEHKMEEDPLSKYDFDMLRNKIWDLQHLPNGETVTLPCYNAQTGAGISLAQYSMEEETPDDATYLMREISGPVEIILLEGDFQPLLEPDYVIYYHLSDNLRWKNRLRRDSFQRNELDMQALRENFLHRLKRQQLPFTLPVAGGADLIVSISIRRKGGAYLFDVYEKSLKTQRTFTKVNYLQAISQDITAHNGMGIIHFSRIMESSRFSSSCNFIDYAIVPRGSSIGKHTHFDSEEIYCIIAGAGSMIINGLPIAIAQGDVVVTAPGGTHTLINNGEVDLVMLVIENAVALQEDK